MKSHYALNLHYNQLTGALNVISHSKEHFSNGLLNLAAARTAANTLYKASQIETMHDLNSWLRCSTALHRIGNAVVDQNWWSRVTKTNWNKNLMNHHKQLQIKCLMRTFDGKWDETSRRLVIVRPESQNPTKPKVQIVGPNHFHKPENELKHIEDGDFHPHDDPLYLQPTIFPRKLEGLKASLRHDSDNPYAPALKTSTNLR
jgi:hypothetical protein